MGPRRDRGRFDDDDGGMGGRGPPPMAQNSRMMRGPPREFEERPPPPVPTNSRFAAFAAEEAIERERENREREERRAQRQQEYEERTGGQGGGRYGERYGDDRGPGGRFGGRSDRNSGDDGFPSLMNNKTEFIKPELPKHLQPKKEPEPVLPPVAAPLTLPGEDEETAKARIEKKKREEEEKKLAEQKAAEEAAAKKAAEEAAAADEAKKAAEVEGDLLATFVNGGKSGDDLKVWCEEQGAILPSVEKLVYALLSEKEKAEPNPECLWAESGNYGTALVSLVEDNLSAMMEVLFAIQRFCVDIGFPKINGEALIQAMFRAMYKFDLADEEAFSEWKDDESPEREDGKGKTIIQTMDWFNWLEEDDDDEDEEEYEEYE